MRLGLIARADSRGLGIQTRAVHDHLHPTKTLVVNCPSAKPLPIRRDWYPNATWTNHWPTDRDMHNWLHNLDVVYTAETPYSQSLFTIAPQRGIRTILHVNPEFLDHMRKRYLPKPTLFAAPSTWMYDQLPNPKALLPVPVDLNRFTPQTANQATNFLHIVGRPAEHDRAGTTDLLQALKLVHTEITVTITCQERGYVRSLVLATGGLPRNIDLRISDGDTNNYWDLYTGQHVLISPRRFGGLSLPMQEACAAGMPVIAPAVSPNVDWLPSEWLVPATLAGSFMAHTTVDLYTVDHAALAAKIDSMASDNASYRNASAQAAGIGKALSWDNLKPEYERILAG